MILLLTLEKREKEDFKIKPKQGTERALGKCERISSAIAGVSWRKVTIAVNGCGACLRQYPVTEASSRISNRTVLSHT